MARLRKKEEIIVGLDIGTSKVCVVVGELNGEGELEIIGLGTAPSKGMKKGSVIAIDSTVEAIDAALEEAELMAGCALNEAYVNISGNHVQGINSQGVVALKDREVKKTDIQRVLDGARAIPLTHDRDILHLIPQHYQIDDQDSILKPLGMSGVRLEAKAHLVTASKTSIQNINKCVTQSGLTFPAIILDAIASSEAILNEDEKELGVALVDIGAGTTDIAIFESGSLVHTAVLPIGGDQITNDIAIGMRTPTPDAERIKIKYGCAKSNAIRHEETLQVPGVAGRRPKKLSRTLLAEIIEPRVEEILQMIRKEIRSSGYEDLLASGLVLTGGTTQLDGLCEFAEEITGLPVKRGMPQGVGGLIDLVRSPVYGTSIGLIQYAIKQNQRPLLRSAVPQQWVRHLKRLKGWFAEFF